MSLPRLIVPKRHPDGRGWLAETFNEARLRALGIDCRFVQDNQSYSQRAGTLRGMHFQAPPFEQAKLISVLRGRALDVAVDVRRGSPTFGRWVAVTLTSDNFRQCYVPPGFAHGFCVVSPIAQVEYKCTDLYDRASEIGVAWNDPALAIPWPVREPILSRRDSRHPTLAQLGDQLPVWHG